MTDNRITKLLRDYTSALLRLEYDADKPGSKMTLGEYEAEEKRVTDEYAQAIAATLSRPKAKAHPYGYEPDTGAFDCTRCECGCINDISATYCNDCGGEIEIDMYAEKEIYHIPCHLVFAEKHDDGSLEFGGKRYVAATLGSGTLTAAQVRECVEKHWHDLSDEYDMPEATALPEYSYDWQAIADELNSRVKPPCDGGYCPLCGAIERTCRKVIPDEMEGYVFCSECGAEIGEYGYPNYCQNCGCKVLRNTPKCSETTTKVVVE